MEYLSMSYGTVPHNKALFEQEKSSLVCDNNKEAWRQIYIVYCKLGS